MKNWLIKFVLILVYFITTIPLRLIFKIKSNHKNFHIDASKLYILASNHPSKLDPFLVLCSLPFKKYIKLLPIHFLTTDDYMRKWYKKVFLLPLGCVSTEEINGIKPLIKLKISLENKETVYIFPRGALEKNKKIGPPRVGVVYMEREVKESLIAPINISIKNNISLYDILRRRIKVFIEFKKPFRHHKFKKDLQPLADDVMKRIYKNE